MPKIRVIPFPFVYLERLNSNRVINHSLSFVSIQIVTGPSFINCNFHIRSKYTRVILFYQGLLITVLQIFHKAVWLFLLCLLLYRKGGFLFWLKPVR